jgi:signal transduction histidine kinase
LVRELTLLHGGSAGAHSEGPGKGSTFTLRFPLAEAPALV